MTKPPTAQGISRLLAAAGFERSTSRSSRVRGWRNYSPGYEVKADELDRGRGCVRVRHLTGSALGGYRERREMLTEYAETIRTKGWSVKGPQDEGFPSLTVTAEETPSPTGEGQQ